MTTILIHGAAVWPDGPSPTLRRRAVHGAQLWHINQDAWVIPCGGIGKHGPSEATVMRDLLEEQGVHPQKILQEAHSTNTLTNIQLALPLIRLLDAGPTIIVTDRYHAKRALMVAKHFGLDATTSSPDITMQGVLAAPRNYLREILARQQYRAKLLRTPKTY